MTPRFNLVDERWIPCLLPDNRTKDLSLWEVLIQAHQIREIFHPSPLVVTALHRLLLAILHRNFGPETLEDWQNLWQRGRWDETVLREYFARWRDRFYLFHPERPEMPEARIHPVQILALEAASGNNTTLFDHNFTDRPATFSSAQAACYLLARQSFSIGFGKSYPFYFQDSPLIRGHTVFIIGNNLWETLALNLVGYDQERPVPRHGRDLPFWELDSLPQPDASGNRVHGYLAYLTWPSRRIHLIPEGQPPVVRFCQIQQNLKLPEPQPLDPFKSYRRDDKRGWVAIGLLPERTVWRDSHTLFQAADPSSQRPGVFDWAARIERLRRAGEIEAKKSYRFTITGLVTEAGKAANLLLWRQERLPLPLAYLEDKDLLDRLKEALHLAEKAHDILRWGLREVASLVLWPESRESGAPGRGPDRGEVDRLLKAWAPGRLYWSGLEAHFRQFLVELPEDREEDEMAPHRDPNRGPGLPGDRRRSGENCALPEGRGQSGGAVPVPVIQVEWR
ncbi:MAG: type I-E CRISPR-associated protein Cse1/CasA [Deltaproteobacteria bacterium]|nr:type I-E CRISPR-associated protein Cse1/CasA [Deltaproteobacteria bacterium]